MNVRTTTQFLTAAAAGAAAAAEAAAAAATAAAAAAAAEEAAAGCGGGDGGWIHRGQMGWDTEEPVEELAETGWTERESRRPFDFFLSTTRFDNKHMRSSLASMRSVAGRGLVTQGRSGRVGAPSITRREIERHSVPSGVTSGSESHRAGGPWPRVSQVPTEKPISLRPSNFVCECCPKVG